MRTLSPEAPLGMGRVLEGLFQTATVAIEQPAVVVAPQPALLDEAVRKIGAPMRTVSIDQAVGSAEVAIQDEILAHEPHRLDGIFVLSSPAAAIGIQ